MGTMECIFILSKRKACLIEAVLTNAQNLIFFFLFYPKLSLLFSDHNPSLLVGGLMLISLETIYIFEQKQKIKNKHIFFFHLKSFIFTAVKIAADNIGAFV